MPEESNEIKVTRSHHTVLPEVETRFSIHTHPKAICHPEGSEILWFWTNYQ